MKTSITSVFFLAIFPAIFAQEVNYFEGNFYPPIEVVIDSLDSNNSWEIGPPQKLIFKEAASKPNVLVTKLDTSYPKSDSSKVIIKVSKQDIPIGIRALRWKQKLDLDSGKDFAFIEFSRDSINWQNGFDNPNVYNFYGYDSNNVYAVDSNNKAFSGTDTTWRDIWFCFDASWMYINNDSNFYVRFRMQADSLDNFKEGWMIDNFIVHPTWVHTVGEEIQDTYVKLSPNPTKGRLDISLKKQDSFHIIEKLQVFDAQGQRIILRENIPTKYWIDLSSQPPGSYCLIIQSNITSEVHQVIVE